MYVDMMFKKVSYFIIAEAAFYFIFASILTLQLRYPNEVLLIVLFVINTIYGLQELSEMCLLRFWYFASPWNIIDSTRVVLAHVYL
jgi:hypothetical protein